MFEAYKIGITIGLTNKVSQGLSAIRKDLLATHGVTVDLTKKLEALKMIGIGGLGMGAGLGILGFMHKTLDASKEYTRQISLMNASGMTQVEVAQSVAAAWKTSRDVVTSSAQENLAAIRELRSVFGKGEGMQEAYAVLPIVQRTKAIMEALTGKEQHGIAAAMVKTAELRAPGMVTPDVLTRNAEGMSKALMAFGGTLQVQDFLGAMKMSKMAGLRLSDDYVYNYMPTLMQDMKTGVGGGGAQTAGTAMFSAYQAIVAGQGIKKSARPLWEQLGLINPSDVVGNQGGHVQLKPGAVRGASLFQSNPEQWAVTVLGPAIASYVQKNPKLNNEQVIAGLFGNRNAQFLMNTFIAKQAQFERDKTLIGATGSSYDTYQKLLKTNPQLADMALHKQWTNIMAQIGYTIMPTLVPLMVQFANALGSLAQWMHVHPQRLKLMAISLSAIGVGLTVLGAGLLAVGTAKLFGITALLSQLPILSSAAAGAAIGISSVVVALAGAAALVEHHQDVANWIDKHKWGQRIGDFLAFGDQSGPVRRDFVAPTPANKTIQVSTQVNLDGRAVAQAVTKHQSQAISYAPNAGSVFDSRLSYSPVH